MKGIVVFTFLLLALRTHAQDSTLYLKYEKDRDYAVAYVNDRAGNEITGLMHITPSYSKVVLITKNGKKVYLPKDLRSYNLEFKDYVSDGKSFYKVIYVGKVGLFEKIVYKQKTMESGGMTMPTGVQEFTVAYFCKTGTTEFKEIKKMGFKAEFSKYFADCEILSLKIKKGDLTIEDLDLIRYIYNNDCKE